MLIIKSCKYFGVLIAYILSVIVRIWPLVFWQILTLFPNPSYKWDLDAKGYKDAREEYWKTLATPTLNLILLWFFWEAKFRAIENCCTTDDVKNKRKWIYKFSPSGSADYAKHLMNKDA